jgi:hypothetical protein
MSRFANTPLGVQAHLHYLAFHLLARSYMTQLNATLSLGPTFPIQWQRCSLSDDVLVDATLACLELSVPLSQLPLTHLWRCPLTRPVMPKATEDDKARRNEERRLQKRARGAIACAECRRYAFAANLFIAWLTREREIG